MSELTRNLILLMWVGAARAEASPTQLRLLRSDGMAAMERYRRCELTADDVEALIARIMCGPGLEWKPTGTWARQIEAFGGQL